MLKNTPRAYATLHDMLRKETERSMSLSDHMLGGYRNMHPQLSLPNCYILNVLKGVSKYAAFRYTYRFLRKSILVEMVEIRKFNKHVFELKKPCFVLANQI